MVFPPSIPRLFRRWPDLVVLGVAVFAVAYVLAGLRDVPTFEGNLAPPFTLTRMNGGRVTLAELRGKIIVLDFWATWCGPCRKSLPLVEDFARRNPDIRVLAVDVGEPPAIVAAFVQSRSLENVGLDVDKRIARAYDVNSYPTIVMIDSRGTYRRRWTGYDPSTVRSLNETRITLENNDPL
ncbi:MAG TPA: TlpA disulfide reductase family protein [Candidatus Baltobacteraceae bacterium]|nr:TlpA disulfide reductase family protein [Candidatus Baltobacteraceae bacterium]